MDVVTMAADVARNGFNVTHELGEYCVLLCKSVKNTVSSVPVVTEHQHHSVPYVCSGFPGEALDKVKDQNVSDAFRDLFLPNGQAPLPGLFTRRLDLAAILDAVAQTGISEFYGGNLMQEMAAAVRENPFFHSFLHLCFTPDPTLHGESFESFLLRLHLWRMNLGCLYLALKLEHLLTITPNVVIKHFPRQH